MELLTKAEIGERKDLDGLFFASHEEVESMRRLPGANAPVARESYIWEDDSSTNTTYPSTSSYRWSGKDTQLACSRWRGENSISVYARCPGDIPSGFCSECDACKPSLSATLKAAMLTIVVRAA